MQLLAAETAHAAQSFMVCSPTGGKYLRRSTPLISSAAGAAVKSDPEAKSSAFGSAAPVCAKSELGI